MSQTDRSVSAALTADEWEQIISAADCGIRSIDPERQRQYMDTITKLERQLFGKERP